MPRSSGKEPKYLMCTRALALVTGLAGGVTIAGSTASASVHDGGPVGVAVNPDALARNPDAGDAQPPASVYDGGVHGVLVHPTDSGCGCGLGGDPASPRGPLAAGLVGAGLIARRRRRSDVP